MELLQLRYFHEVAQTQHMTNSAKRLGVAQPALTQAIRRLEGELDAKLFERAGRNIRLTPCGEALEPHSMRSPWPLRRRKARNATRCASTSKPQHP